MQQASGYVTVDDGQSPGQIITQNLTGNASVTDIGPLRICWCVELYD